MSETDSCIEGSTRLPYALVEHHYEIKNPWRPPVPQYLWADSEANQTAFQEDVIKVRLARLLNTLFDASMCNFYEDCADTDAAL